MALWLSCGSSAPAMNCEGGAKGRLSVVTYLNLSHCEYAIVEKHGLLENGLRRHWVQRSKIFPAESKPENIAIALYNKHYYEKKEKVGENNVTL